MAKINASDEFEEITRVLGTQYRLLNCFFNKGAGECGAWQGRIYGVIESRKVFFDVIDSKRLAVAIHAPDHTKPLPGTAILNLRKMVSAITPGARFIGGSADE